MGESGMRLILGSNSERRADLLRKVGYVFEQVSPGYDDTGVVLEGMGVEEQVVELAGRKAESLRETVEDAVVIAGDTVLWFDEAVIGKPKDVADAERILRNLFGSRHEVVSGVVVVDTGSGKSESIVDVAEVMMPHVDEGLLREHLESGAWEGKAGGYNYFEIERKWELAVWGDVTTVVGLPMKKLIPVLDGFGVKRG